MNVTNRRPGGFRLAGALAMLGVLWTSLIAGTPSVAFAELEANLLIVGDWGFTPPATRNLALRKVAQAMAAYVRHGEIAYDAVLVAGDNFRTRKLTPATSTAS